MTDLSLKRNTQPKPLPKIPAPYYNKDPDKIPDHLIKHLIHREDKRNDVYEDSLLIPTVGVGHRLTAEEKKKWPVGTVISDKEVEKLLEQDSRWAYKSAKKQAKQINRPDLTDALFHVNFQLGPTWNVDTAQRKGHTKTWKLMTEGKFNDAAVEAANSKWFIQTPDRVKDFQEALRRAGNNSRSQLI